MNIQEMHYDFKMKFNKLDSQGLRNLSVPEIDWLLNEAILMFVKQRFGMNNNTKSGFENTEKRIQDLKELIVKPPESPPLTPLLVPNSPGQYYIDFSLLNEPLLFLIRSYSDARGNKCSTFCNNIIVQHDDLNDILKHPFYKPSIEWGEIIAVLGNNGENDRGRMYLYTNNEFTINSVFVEYVKYPKKVAAPSLFGGQYYLPDGTTLITADENCELSAHTHSEIVDIAVSNGYYYTQHPAIQWAQNKLNLNE